MTDALGGGGSVRGEGGYGEGEGGSQGNDKREKKWEEKRFHLNGRAER